MGVARRRRRLVQLGECTAISTSLRQIMTNLPFRGPSHGFALATLRVPSDCACRDFPVVLGAGGHAARRVRSLARLEASNLARSFESSIPIRLSVTAQVVVLVVLLNALSLLLGLKCFSLV